MDLHAQRQSSESGPQPISFQEIANYFLIEGAWVPASCHQLYSRLVRGVDAEYLEIIQERRQRDMARLTTNRQG